MTSASSSVVLGLSVLLLAACSDGGTSRTPARMAAYQAAPAGRSTTIDDLPALPSPMTLDDILVIVRRHHPAVQAARERVSAAGWRIDQQRAWPDPRLVIEGLGLHDGRQEPSLMLMQRLPWFGSRERMAAVATAESQVAMQEMIAVEVALERELRILHYRWSAALLRRPLVSAARSRSAQIVGLVQAWAAAATDQVALIDRRRDLAVLDDRLRRLDGEAAQWRDRLLVRAGLPRDVELVVPDALPPAPSSDLPEVVRQRLEHDAVALRLLRERVAAAADRVDAVARQTWPEPTVGIGYDQSMMGDKRWMLSLAISIPLARSARQASVDEARARQRAAQFDLIDRHQRLEETVAQQLFVLDDARQQETLARDVLLASAERVRVILDQAYRAGRRDAEALFDRDLRVLEAREAIISARITQLVAAAELAAILGGAP